MELDCGHPLCCFYCSNIYGEIRRSTEGLLFDERFVDDVFFIWHELIFTLLSHLNSLASTIKLTWKFSQQEINFLEHGCHIVRLYQKPLKCYLYIQIMQSYHVRLSLSLSEYLKIRNKCFNMLQNGGTYLLSFFCQRLSEVQYNSCRKYLSRNRQVQGCVCSVFKMFRNRLFYDIRLKDLLLSHVEKLIFKMLLSVYKATDNLAKLKLHNLVNIFWA